MKANAIHTTDSHPIRRTPKSQIPIDDTSKVPWKTDKKQHVSLFNAPRRVLTQRIKLSSTARREQWRHVESCDVELLVFANGLFWREDNGVPSVEAKAQFQSGLSMRAF